MAGNSVSEMIFFIAAILISSVVAVAFIEVIGNYSEDLEQEASLLRGEIRSRMDIVNDPLNVPYDNSTANLTFYIMNTGTGRLSTDSLVVGANGTTAAGSNLYAEVLGDSTEWVPGAVVSATFNVTGLIEGVDYSGWASTTGLSDGGQIRGHANDELSFRIRGS